MWERRDFEVVGAVVFTVGRLAYSAGSRKLGIVRKQTANLEKPI